MHGTTVEAYECIASPDSGEHLPQRGVRGKYTEIAMVKIMFADLNKASDVLATIYEVYPTFFMPR
jgi:hypothetical protein